jgi:hypothetical protein
MLRCPNCNGKDIGKIGAQQYYCWTCFIEMTINNNKVKIHEIEADGSLCSLDDLFTDEERKINTPPA